MARDPEVYGFRSSVKEQIDVIREVRNAGGTAADEVYVFDELLDAWRDDTFSSRSRALEVLRQRNGSSFDYEGRYFRELVALAKRKRLLGVIEEEVV